LAQLADDTVSPDDPADGPSPPVAPRHQTLALPRGANGALSLPVDADDAVPLPEMTDDRTLADEPFETPIPPAPPADPNLAPPRGTDRALPAQVDGDDAIPPSDVGDDNGPIDEPVEAPLAPVAPPDSTLVLPEGPDDWSDDLPFLPKEDGPRPPRRLDDRPGGLDRDAKEEGRTGR